MVKLYSRMSRHVSTLTAPSSRAPFTLTASFYKFYISGELTNNLAVWYLVNLRLVWKTIFFKWWVSYEIGEILNWQKIWKMQTWFYLYYHCVYGCLLCIVLSNSVSYVFLLLCLSILIVMYVLFCIFYFHRANWHSSATLTEVLRAFSSVVRQMPGHNSQ